MIKVSEVSDRHNDHVYNQLDRSLSHLARDYCLTESLPKLNMVKQLLLCGSTGLYGIR